MLKDASNVRRMSGCKGAKVMARRVLSLQIWYPLTGGQNLDFQVPFFVFVVLLCFGWCMDSIDVV